MSSSTGSVSLYVVSSIGSTPEKDETAGNSDEQLSEGFVHRKVVASPASIKACEKDNFVASLR